MNEAIIAKEVKQAQSTMGIKRENVFIATKLPPKDQGYEKTKAAVERSLKALSDVQYIDLMLLTFPSTPGLDPKDQQNVENRHDAWKVLEEYVVNGQIKSIGVANFKPRHLEPLLKLAWIKPTVNQVETHPLYTEHDTLSLCHEHDILIEAYSPLA